MANALKSISLCDGRAVDGVFIQIPTYESTRIFTMLFLKKSSSQLSGDIINVS